MIFIHLLIHKWLCGQHSEAIIPSLWWLDSRETNHAFPHAASNPDGKPIKPTSVFIYWDTINSNGDRNHQKRGFEARNIAFVQMNWWRDEKIWRQSPCLTAFFWYMYLQGVWDTFSVWPHLEPTGRRCTPHVFRYRFFFFCWEVPRIRGFP